MANKPDRMAKLEAAAAQVDREGIMRPAMVASVIGLCQFSCAQVLGRAGAPGVRRLRELLKKGAISAEQAQAYFR